MDLTTFTELISTLGFPIACVIGLGVFVFIIYKNTTTESKTREEKLYSFLEDSAAINAKFAEIIARYETKLDEIKQDVKDIKTDIIEIKA